MLIFTTKLLNQIEHLLVTWNSRCSLSGPTSSSNL